jgi:hypothetical protein
MMISILNLLNFRFYYPNFIIKQQNTKDTRKNKKK